MFDGVWCGPDNKIFVKRHALGSLEFMTWQEAAALVELAGKPIGKAEKLSVVQSLGRKPGVGTGKLAGNG
jgi:hypothetical protein